MKSILFSCNSPAPHTMLRPRTPHNVAEKRRFSPGVATIGRDALMVCPQSPCVFVYLPLTDSTLCGVRGHKTWKRFYMKKSCERFFLIFHDISYHASIQHCGGAGARKNQAMIDFPSRNGPKRRTQLRWCIKIIVRFVHGKRMFLEWPKPHSVDFFWRAEMLYFLMILTNFINH